MILFIPMRKTHPDSTHRPSRVRKIAISLPAALLAEIERRRATTGDTRSGLVARALEVYLHDTDAALRVRTYVESHVETPERPSDVAEAQATAGYAFDGDRWE